VFQRAERHTLQNGGGRYLRGVPPTEFTAYAADAQLACARRGSGAPLLLIMGVAGHQKIWNDRFLNRLAAEYEVVTYDHRGIGDSSYAESFTLDDLVADAVAVMDWAGLSDAHVLGFSMGGAIAQQLAVSHPERLRSLTLVATWPDTEDVFGDGVLKFLGAGQAEDPETAAWMMFEANVSPSFAADDANFPPFRDAALAEKVPVPVVMAQMAATAGHDVIARLPGVRVPTLVVHGTQDAVIKASAGERLAGAIPGARLELWPGLGHHIAWEAPDRLADVVLAHVTSVT
jgi:3-oxoadipate enol-lactonase